MKERLFCRDPEHRLMLLIGGTGPWSHLEETDVKSCVPRSGALGRAHLITLDGIGLVELVLW